MLPYKKDGKVRRKNTHQLQGSMYFRGQGRENRGRISGFGCNCNHLFFLNKQTNKKGSEAKMAKCPHQLYGWWEHR